MMPCWLMAGAPAFRGGRIRLEQQTNFTGNRSILDTGLDRGEPLGMPVTISRAGESAR